MTQTPALVPGQPFPDFALEDGEGRLHRLEDYRGRYLLLYVYPRDDTPGCTKEACDFRDALELREAGAAILGLSADDAASHQAFSQKYSLNFPLLSDPDHQLIRTLGAWGSKNLYGKVSEGVKRSSYLIDPQGRLLRLWPSVRVEGHAAEVTRTLLEHAARQAQLPQG